MPVYRQIVIKCDNPGCDSSFLGYKYESTRIAEIKSSIMSAQSAGWSLIRDKNHKIRVLCPECLERG